MLLLSLADEPPPPPATELDAVDSLYLRAPANCSSPSGRPGDVALQDFGLRPATPIGYVGKVQVVRVDELDPAAREPDLVEEVQSSYHPNTGE